MATTSKTGRVGRSALCPSCGCYHELRARCGPVVARPVPGLTHRENQILLLLASALSNRDMARELAVSEETVKRHLTNIFDKTGMSSRLELLLYALERLGVNPQMNQMAAELEAAHARVAELETTVRVLREVRV